MSHPRSRGHRRKLRAHIIDRRAKQRPHWFDHYSTSPDDQRLLARARARLGDVATPCSCAMCGNPRRYFNALTLAEKRAALRGQEWDGRDNMEE